MRSIRPHFLLPALLVPALSVSISGCSPYDPPVQGDHTSQTYKTDLEKCRTDSTETVRRKNAATPGVWIVSPFTGPPEVRADIRTCLAAKGYKLDNTGG
jgi:hypothetical protein